MGGRSKSDLYGAAALVVSIMAVGLAVQLGIAGASPHRQPVPCGTATPAASPSPSPSPTVSPTSEPTPNPGCSPPSPSPSPSPTPSPVRTIRARSAVTIVYDGVFFRGTVTSKRELCVVRRQVLLKKSHREDSPTTEGQDRTTESGRWRIRGETASGRFYAVAAQRKARLGDGSVLICRSTRSEDSILITGG